MKTDHSARFKQCTLFPWIELRQANQSTACYDAHSHDEFSFGLILDGQAIYQNKQTTHYISTGDIVTINPVDVHSCNPISATWSYNMLFVEPINLGRIQHDIWGIAPKQYEPFLRDVERKDSLKQTFIELYSSLHHSTSALHTETCLYQFIEDCFEKPEGFENLGGFKKSASKVTKDLKHSPNISLVRDKLFDELEKPHQLEDLSSEVGLTRFQLLKAFKNQYGMPPYAYLMDEKIKRSKTMLKSGHALSDVALALGFSDQAHFQRQFKKKLAVTPKFYQSHFINRETG